MMRNASNAVARSIGRLIALVLFAAVVIVIGVVSGVIPWSFAP